MYSVHTLGNSVCWGASIGCNLEHQQWPLQWQFSVIFTMSGKRGCFRDVELWHCQLCLSQTDLIPAPKSLPPPWSWPRTPCQPRRAISPMLHSAGLQTHSALPCLAMGLNPFPSPDITEELMLKAKFHTPLGSSWQAHSDSAFILLLVLTELLLNLKTGFTARCAPALEPKLLRNCSDSSLIIFILIGMWKTIAMWVTGASIFHTSLVTSSSDKPRPNNCHFDKSIKSVRLQGFTI